jgi:hypothetical protein
MRPRAAAHLRPVGEAGDPGKPCGSLDEVDHVEVGEEPAPAAEAPGAEDARNAREREPSEREVRAGVREGDVEERGPEQERREPPEEADQVRRVEGEGSARGTGPQATSGFHNMPRGSSRTERASGGG